MAVTRRDLLQDVDHVWRGLPWCQCVVQAGPFEQSLGTRKQLSMPDRSHGGGPN